MSDFSFADEAKKSRLIIFRRFYKCSSSYKMYVFPGLFIFQMLYYNFVIKRSSVFRKKKIFVLTLNKVVSIPFFRVEESLLAFD